MIKKLDRYVIETYEEINQQYMEDEKPLVITKVSDLNRYLYFNNEFILLLSAPVFSYLLLLLVDQINNKFELHLWTYISLHEDRGLNQIMMISGLSILFYIINELVIQISGKFIIKKLHNILPEKDKRENEILTFYQVQKELFDSTIPLNVMQKSAQAIEDWEKLSPKEFCLKYFNIDTTNFVQYVKERGSYNGAIQDSFIAFITNIPKSNEMSIDSLRKIMIHPIAEEQLVHKEHLELVFANYTPVQIEKIFTNYLGKDQFEELLTVAQPAAIYPNFLELLENETKQVKTLTSALEEIHNRCISNFKIKVLRTKKDYTNASLEFANCVRGYFSHSGNVITFFKDSEPVACVYIEYNEISQIKGYRNAECNKKSEVIKILKEHNIITG